MIFNLTFFNGFTNFIKFHSFIISSIKKEKNVPLMYKNILTKQWNENVDEKIILINE